MKGKRKDYIKTKFDDGYTEKTMDFIYKVVESLEAKHGKIKAEWWATLNLLADNFQTFNRCSEIIRIEGMQVSNRFGELVKHPLISVKKDAQIQYVKLLSEFGITPRQMSKVESADDEDDENDYLTSITNK